MRRMAVVLALCALFGAPLLTPVEASDGDVDYSAPYITIDPETGELITVNPGPRPVMHDMEMNAGREHSQGQPAARNSPHAAQDTSRSQPNYYLIFGFAAAIVALLAFALRMMKRQTPRESSRSQPV